MLMSARDRTERQERKAEEDVEREERNQEWWNTPRNTSRSTRRSFMLWLVILVITRELVTVLWVVSNTT